MGRVWVPPNKEVQPVQPVQENVPRGTIPAETKLSVEDREFIKREIEEKKSIIENKDDGEFVSVSVAGQNPEAVTHMKREIKKKEIALQKDEDLRAKGSDKDRLHREIKKLEDEIKPHMPTHNEMWAKTGTTESDYAVRHNREFQKNY